MSVLPTSAEGLQEAGIFRAFSFEGLKSVIVAVSGGSDSLALLSLLTEYKASRPAFPEICAVTIDHGLRAESADEARYVASLCKKAGITHRILNWVGPKRDSGLPAKARAARYGLLCQAARDAATDIILTGHTLDDQIETFVMRSARAHEQGSERGLAGMAPVTLLDREIFLIRPLLEISREALRDYLRAKGVAWRDDPSNDDAKYERVRIRQALRSADRSAIQREIAEKIAQRRARNARTAHMLPHCVSIGDGTRAEIDRKYWNSQDEDVRRLAIGVLLAALGGLSFLPPHEICERAVRFLEGEDQSGGRMTLGRCVIDSKRSKVLIYREMRSIPQITVEAGQAMIWDGRYRICNDTDKPVQITAMGAGGERSREEGGVSVVPARALQSAPALHFDGEIFGVAANADHAKLPPGIGLMRHLALFDHILSGYDEALAQSVADIFRLQAYKRFPVNQINKN